MLQLHVLPEGASEPAALLGCIRLVHWLAQPHVLGQQPLTLVVDCGTGVTATGKALLLCYAKQACASYHVKLTVLASSCPGRH